MRRPRARRQETRSGEEAHAASPGQKLEGEPGGLGHGRLEARAPARVGGPGPVNVEEDQRVPPLLRRPLLDDELPLPRRLRPVDVARVVAKDGIAD